MKEIKKLWYIFDSRQKMQILGLMILILIGTILETLGVTVIVPFIEAIMYPQKIMKNEYVQIISQYLKIQSAEQFIILMAIVLIGIYICKNLYLICMYGVQFRFVYNNQRRLSNDMIKCYLNQPYSFHLKHNSAELQNNIYNEVESFFNTVLYMINVVTDATVCVALIVVLFITDKSITIGVAVLLALFILVFYRRFRQEIYRLGIERKQGSQESIKAIQHSLGGIKEIKVLGRESYFQRSYDKSYFKFVDAKRKVNTYSMSPKPLMETICVAGLLLIVSVKIYRGVDIEYFIPTLSVFALAVIRILPSTSRLATNINNVLFGMVSINAIYEDLNAMRILNQNKVQVEGNSELEKYLAKDIKIDNLCFAYEDGKTNVLEGVSLTIPKNKSVAFIGPSGAGKTTLADVILGILPYQQGKICIGDIELNVNSEKWKNYIGYIPQNIFIIDDTIRRNIALGIEDENIDDDRMWKALEDAQLKEFVQDLDNGLDTILGERGVRISGGQKQRIGIARALYHNPELLVLDEATSALDNETEKAVMEAIEALSGKKTLIIIAHRLSTIENCDYVYRIENGKAILEKGQS